MKKIIQLHSCGRTVEFAVSGDYVCITYSSTGKVRYGQPISRHRGRTLYKKLVADGWKKIHERSL